MRCLVLICCALPLIGCTTPALVTVHVNEDWVSPGVYKVPAAKYKQLISKLVEPYAKSGVNLNWRSNVVLTVEYRGNKIDMFAADLPDRSLSFFDDKGNRMLFVGGQCMLGRELGPHRKKEGNDASQQSTGTVTQEAAQSASP